jgi:hypothetical protein
MTRREVAELPWLCPDHPAAQIRHEWDQSHYVMNGYPAGEGVKSDHQYFCAECGRKLAAEETTNEPTT